MKNIAIVLAGGRGSRMESDIPKQYMSLCGKPVLYYALNAFQNSVIDEIIIVSGADDVEHCQKEIVEKYGMTKVSKVVSGGKERYDSVINGLRAIEGTDGYVFIHDGARPCVSEGIIERCLQDVKKHKACVAAVPVKDTIKVVDKERFSVTTPDRSTLWQIQTPQVFELALVRQAYEKMYRDEARGNITDDAMVVEKYSDTRVKMSLGGYNNIKITTPEDMIIAAAMLSE